MTHIVVFSVDENGRQYVATHGKSEKDAQEAAIAGNNLKKALNWPVEDCNSKPLERICKNCSFYEVDRGIHCANGWSGSGRAGYCLYEPKRVSTRSDSKCSHFEPKE